MIYNYGTLGFYTAKANRQYDNTDNDTIIHHFVTDSIPDVQIIVDSAVASATYKLYDEDDTEIASGTCTVNSTTNDAGTAYSQITIEDETTSGQADGKYYLKVTYGTTDLYSDMFCWRTTVSGYLKIEAQTSALKIGAFPTADFTYTVYFDSQKYQEEYEIQEEGEEKTYGIVPSFVSRNRVHTHEIAGYDKTYNFLSGLRAVEVNGTIKVTWNSEENEVYDVSVEKKSTFANDLYVIELKFKLKDYLQTHNIV